MTRPTPASSDQVVGQLQPAPYNPRKISPEGLENLAASLREFGDLSGIVRNVRTDRLVGGHQRALIAAEDTGRVAYGTEISPAYCDVIVRRWEAKTKKRATRAREKANRKN